MAKSRLSFASAPIRAEMKERGATVVASRAVSLLNEKMLDYTQACAAKAKDAAKDQKHVILTVGDFQDAIKKGCMGASPVSVAVSSDAVSLSRLHFILKKADGGKKEKIAGDVTPFMQEQLTWKIANITDIALDIAHHSKRIKINLFDVKMAAQLPLR